VKVWLPLTLTEPEVGVIETDETVDELEDPPPHACRRTAANSKKKKLTLRTGTARRPFNPSMHEERAGTFIETPAIYFDRL
jgi:hypothetical protein